MSISERKCQQCGTPLGPNESYCSNCGAPYREQYVPTQFASPYQPPASPAYQGSSNPNQPNQSPIEPTQYASPPYGSAPYGNTSYGSPDAGYAPPPPPPNVGYTPPPPVNAPNYGAQPGLYGQPPAYQPNQVGAYGQPPQAEPPRPKRGPNVPLIIGIIVLLLILLGGGLFLLGRGKGNTTATTNGTTPTANATTPTAAVTPTPAPLFIDNFADASKGWDTTGGSGYSRTIANNALTLTDSNHKILPETLPTNTTYDDLSVTSTFTLVQADQNDGAGIYVRGDSNLDHDYRVEIFGDATYAIGKEYIDSNNNPTVTALVQPTSSSAINPKGQSNKVTVILKGSTIVLLINGTFITSITDTSYTKGQIALFVQNGDTSSGATASFSSIEVDPAPAQLPTS